MKKLIQHLTSALVFAPVLVAGLVVAAPQAAAAATSTPDCSSIGSSADIGAGALCAKPPSAAAQLFGDGSVFQTVTSILLFVIGAIAVIMLIIGGIRYVVSQGDQAAITSAKNTILYAIIG